MTIWRTLSPTSGHSASSSRTPTSPPVSTPTLVPVPPKFNASPSPTPSPSATPEPTPFPTSTPVEGPGYGGHFIDPVDNVVYAYLVNPSPEAVEEVTITHLAPAEYRRMTKIREVRPFQANYTLRQLERLYDHLFSAGIWNFREVAMTDVDEWTNKLQYGIDCEHNRDRVRMQIHDLLSRENIPIDAVTVKVQGRVQFGCPSKFKCAPPEAIDPSTGLSSPGFGGLFWEQGATGLWTLNVYMIEPSQQGAEELALQVVGRESLERVS